MSHFLENIRVVEMGALTAGPCCARILANMGAEVIKIEQPKVGELGRHHGTEMEAKGYFTIQNYNKKCVGLNLKAPEGQEIMEKLLGKTDIFIQNLAPHAMARWNMAPEQVCERHPGIIYCSVGGFGRSGPLCKKRALDTILQSMSGVVDLTGDADGSPLKSGVSSADGSGATAAVGAILAALHYREVTGHGQSIDMSMMDVMGWMTAEKWGAELIDDRRKSRIGNASEFAAPQGVYPCREGYLAVSVQDDAQWASLQSVLREKGLESFPQITTLEGRLNAQAAIDRVLRQMTADEDAYELEVMLQSKAIPASKVMAIHETLADPQLIERKMIVELDDPDVKKIKVLGSPLNGTVSTPCVDRTAPAVGANNHEIFHDLLGIDEKVLAELSARDVI